MPRPTSPEGTGPDVTPVDAGFFLREPERVARDLLGCVLVVDADDGCAGGIIVETEAYLGAHDPGSHAATRGITARNAVMYGPAGTVYVYFTYGCHHMLNLVCLEQGLAGAVLIRALQPTLGLERMRSRRGQLRDVDLCSGPGKLTQALGVDLSDNGSTLGVGRVSVYHGERYGSEMVGLSGRVGLSEGHELELRYYVTDSPYVSRGRTGPSGRAGRARTGRSQQ